MLSPHTDDGELGCGASVSKFIEQGKRVIYVAFSACEQSVLPQFPKGYTDTRGHASHGRVGNQTGRFNLESDLKVRTFNYHRQEILRYISFELRETYKPDTVLIPSVNDIHQDHKTIAEEALRAFKVRQYFQLRVALE